MIKCFYILADLCRNDWKCHGWCPVYWKILSLYVLRVWDSYKYCLFFLYCVVANLYTCMSCNHLCQYSITLSHLLIVSLSSSFQQNTYNCVHVCSCSAYGACGFTHYTRVCSANSSKHYHHWRRGIFINLLFYFQMTCVASIVAHDFSSRKRFVRFSSIFMTVNTT